MFPKRLASLTAALLMVLPACGDDSGGVEVTDAWSRGGQAGANAAVYFTLESGDGDVLTGVSADSSIAADAQLHETVMADMGDDTSDDGMDDMGGAMTMEPVDEVEVPAGGTVAFEPGGHHVMLVNLTSTLEVGATFDITLHFENAGDVVVEVEAMADAP